MIYLWRRRKHFLFMKIPFGVFDENLCIFWYVLVDIRNGMSRSVIPDVLRCLGKYFKLKIRIRVSETEKD